MKTSIQKELLPALVPDDDVVGAPLELLVVGRTLGVAVVLDVGLSGRRLQETHRPRLRWTGPAAPRKTKALHGALGSTESACNTKTLPKPVRLKKTPHNTCTIQSAGFMVASASVVGALFCDPLDSRLLSRLRRPVGRFNTELLGVLRVQPLPAAELHSLATNDAADGSSAEKVI